MDSLLLEDVLKDFEGIDCVVEQTIDALMEFIDEDVSHLSHYNVNVRMYVGDEDGSKIWNRLDKKTFDRFERLTWSDFLDDGDVLKLVIYKFDGEIVGGKLIDITDHWKNEHPHDLDDIEEMDRRLANEIVLYAIDEIRGSLI